MEHSEVQEIMREKHIVVTDMRHETKSFEKALLDIAELSRVTAIQGEQVFFGHNSSLMHLYHAQRSHHSGWL